MDIKEVLKKHWQIAMVLIMYPVGIVGHIIPYTLPLMIFLTPFVLLGLGLVAISPSIINKNWKLLAWCLVVYIITFSLEAIGVATGLIFGEYLYGSTLGFQLFEVPMVIGFNWVLVVLGAVAVGQRIKNKWYVVLPVAGFLAFGFDLPLEFVAMNLDYWDWALGYPPLHNFAAWVIITIAMAGSFKALKLKLDNDLLLIVYLGIQAVFFGFLVLFWVQL